MSEYSDLLEELRESTTRTAKLKIPELYAALKKEKKSPSEARQIIEHDLGDIYQKRTIVAYLPDECKDEIKQKGTEEREKIREEYARSDAAMLAPQLITTDGTVFTQKPDTSIKKLETTFAKAADDIATSTRLALLESKIKDFESKLQPFKTAARCRMKDTELILNVTVNPITQKVICEINETAMAKGRTAK